VTTAYAGASAGARSHRAVRQAAARPGTQALVGPGFIELGRQVQLDHRAARRGHDRPRRDVSLEVGGIVRQPLLAGFGIGMLFMPG
jgi:hypothetical protein